MYNRLLVSIVATFTLTGCGEVFNVIFDDNESEVSTTTAELPTQPPVKTDMEIASEELTQTLLSVSSTGKLDAFLLPESDDFDRIPQDPNNPITEAKVALGKVLFHETGLATAGVNTSLVGTWSCASCHHADAGFKSGVLQGIGEGGEGFGSRGALRSFIDGFSADSDDPTLIPDVQPVTSPTILNTAYQEVMLWNGQFGNQDNGIINNGLPQDVLLKPGTPIAENARGLSGLETQVVAGLGVHRMKIDESSLVMTLPAYAEMFDDAFPNGSEDLTQDVSKAIAAYERTVLANQAPFQQWLRGDQSAMTLDEVRGANLFFGEANCSACHTGPALSSPENAAEHEIFFAIGFADLDESDPAVTGSVPDGIKRGRGGFTNDPDDDYKFKIPTLYNLADTNVFGHGGSFDSVRAVVEYKNNAVPQSADVPVDKLDYRFTPLGLSEQDIDDLVAFLENGLRDSNLQRYVPETLPSGNCPINADEASKADLGCY